VIGGDTQEKGKLTAIYAIYEKNIFVTCK